MKYACAECGSPAVNLPDRLDLDALVHCRDCRSPIATWAVFKRRATQAILAEAHVGAGFDSMSYDPLDASLLGAAAGHSESAAPLKGVPQLVTPSGR